MKDLQVLWCLIQGFSLASSQNNWHFLLKFFRLWVSLSCSLVLYGPLLQQYHFFIKLTALFSIVCGEYKRIEKGQNTQHVKGCKKQKLNKFTHSPPDVINNTASRYTFLQHTLQTKAHTRSLWCQYQNYFSRQQTIFYFRFCFVAFQYNIIVRQISKTKEILNLASLIY